MSDDQQPQIDVELGMRLLCIECGHTEPVRISPLVPPADWFRCPKCGPLEQVDDPAAPGSKESQRRAFRKGGVVIRGRPARSG